MAWKSEKTKHPPKKTSECLPQSRKYSVTPHMFFVFFNVQCVECGQILIPLRIFYISHLQRGVLNTILALCEVLS